MCTVIVGFDPEKSTPVVIAALRDEMLDRAWRPPAAHWPDHPGLVGGRDEREGGTWLAAGTGADPADGPRVAALLNGIPPGAASPTDTVVPPDLRLSRGRLPLLAAESGKLDLPPEDLRRYEPFHLLLADAGRAVLYSWDGRQAVEQRLPVGVTVLVNTGCDSAEPRARRHAPVFAESRPDPEADRLRAADRVADVWGAWPDLLDAAARGGARTGGYGAGADAPSSLVARSEFGDGRVWATSSIALVACTADTLRYAFTAEPGTPGGWYFVR
ncbi:hypothetical protein HNR12_000248 [Streptomonospora nanhaiensis]|uniref:NRDE family protein n=1 Tax=Streptomonospora nanhaiensis TaxID=1323731 RepID=A0A853BH69_9ACTN|nr:NRDE family protein [Streptomonospora nanhaiensis]NYI93971.1 hypothetical protein [Streptomonospora nanhaiensis]